MSRLLIILLLLLAGCENGCETYETCKRNCDERCPPYGGPCRAF